MENDPKQSVERIVRRAMPDPGVEARLRQLFGEGEIGDGDQTQNRGNIYIETY